MHRIVSLLIGMLAMLLFGCTCVWVATTGGDAGEVMSLVLVFVVCLSILAAICWLAADRRPGARTATDVLVDELLHRPSR